uniref:Uncharacterized protein n=1 Tax=Minutocellus polymorphus TaxID=265543 RepID=A0A7S0FHZ4_9STRA|mmetsp:Transcript_11722/g.19498  ORF Transcript_11722/g.19498 Transcript_11722/m.19498 type:complete len:153 (+) Transcript_11722:221-679(+)
MPRRKKWGRVSRMLGLEGADAKVSGMFYVDVVQQILLYGSETWTVSPRVLSALESLHHRVARRLAGKMPRRLPDGSWECPSLEKALEEAGLFPISEYVARRQRTVAQYIALRPIYDIAVEEGRQRGTSTSMRWWEQPIDFAGALAELEEGED